MRVINGLYRIQGSGEPWDVLGFREFRGFRGFRGICGA